MLIKALGGIDIIGGLILVLGALMGFNTKINLILGIIFIAKSSLGLLQDFGSWVDFLCGITLLFSIVFNIPEVILIILGIFVLQKGAFSLMG